MTAHGGVKGSTFVGVLCSVCVTAAAFGWQDARGRVEGTKHSGVGIDEIGAGCPRAFRS
jgi:hypothetical protein